MESDLDIAVIGVSCEFGSAAGLARYWEAIAGAGSLIRDLDAGELRRRGAARQQGQSGIVTRMAALDDIARFDHERFGIPRRDAEIADPQLRLMFDHASRALAAGGCDPERFDGRIGLFGSASTSFDWANQVRDSLGHGLTLAEMSYVDRDFYMTRLAYGLGLTGPAILLNTACSSSLVAVHAAIQSLLAGDCDIALAGACSLRPFWGGYPVQDGGIFSPSGSCMPFSADADGTVPGEGAAFLLLKPLAAARANGDPVFCVIKGSAVNNDGRDKPGYAAPAANGQTAVIRAALDVSGIEPDALGYVECHGTGTRLGDPIEVAALDRALRAWGRTAKLPIGSVKATIGHTDVVAGIAGLLKAALVLRHGTVPPQAALGELNPLCRFEDTLFELARAPQALAGHCAGISSFGVGGTNAHVVIAAGDPGYLLAAPPQAQVLPRFDQLLLQRNDVRAAPSPAPAPAPEPAAEPGIMAALLETLRENAQAGQIVPESRLAELGIDSISVVMITEDLEARLGSTLTPAQFVELETVADLARAIGAERAERGDGAQPGDGAPPEQVPNEAPLTLGQQRFFYPRLADPAAEGYAAVFRLGRDAGAQRVKEAVAATILQHQGLRVRFVRDAEGLWRARYGDYPADGYFVVVEQGSAARFDAAAYSRAVLAELDFTRAPLFFAHLVRFANAAPLLFLFSHHVIYDGYSLNIVFQDLQTHFAGGAAAPATPVSLYAAAQRKWYRELDQQAQDAWWSRPEWRACRPLPVERAAAGVGGMTADEAEYRRGFDAGASDALLEGLKRNKVGMLDLLVYAVSAFYLEEAGGDWLQMSCAFGGRSDLIGAHGHDFSRTVGMLALNGLLLVRRPRGAGALEQIADVKRQLAEMPGRGTAYFIDVADPGPDAARRRQRMPDYDRQIGVNFLGYQSFDKGAQGGPIVLEHEFRVLPPDLERWYRLDFDFGFVDGRFFIGCRYAAGQYGEATIARYVERIAAHLRQVADAH